MARIARASVGGLCSHVINRGNARAEGVRQPADYAARRELLHEAAERVQMRGLASCLRPHHVHVVLRPRGDGERRRLLQWLLTTPVRRSPRHDLSSGPIWQGRFKACPLRSGCPSADSARYLERHPLRAGLVTRADNWRWTSLRERGVRKPWLHLAPVPAPVPAPVRGPTDGVAWVNAPRTEAEVGTLRHRVNRGTAVWQRGVGAPDGPTVKT